MKIISKKILKDSFDRFDLEVEDNHNFIVQNCVVHNSNVSFALIDNQFYVSSKNVTLEKDVENTYWKIAIEYDIERKMREHFTDGSPVWLHGEIFGGNIQKDFNYGLTKPALRLFDIKQNYCWLNYKDFVNTSEQLNLPIVPILYCGPYTKEIVFKWSNDHTKYFENQTHMNEGVVVKPVIERRTRRGERIISKCISDLYLLRKNGTEYN